MAKILKASLNVCLLWLILADEYCDSLSFERVKDNSPHRRVKRSGLIDAEIKSNDQIEKIPIGKPENNFFIYKKRLNWKTAHDVCEKLEGYLASFHTKAEAEDVVNAIFAMSKFSEDYDWGRTQEEFGLDRRYWIGLSDLFEEGKWTWVGQGKSLGYGTMWYPGQPDHVNFDGSIKSGRHQHCGSLWNPAYFKVGPDKKPTEKHTFDDLECDRELYFICQRDEKLLEARKKALEG